MKSSTYLPFLLTLTTTNAAALLPRSPQGPDTNPGEFIDPGLSHSNPQNNKSPSSGPISLVPQPTAVENPVEASSIASASSVAVAAIETAPNYVVLPAANPGTPISAAASTTVSLSPAASSSAAAELNTMMSAIMNTTYLYNETYPYYPGYYNGSYGHHHHHHHHNSSYWNSTDFLNITEYYNATDDVVEIVAVEANGTTTTQYFNATDGYGYGYGYGNYNGSGWGHHNHTGHHNGTGWWAELMANATETGTAALPSGTGMGAGANSYDLTAMPGFTGPKGKRGFKSYGRWLSGVI